MKLVIIGGRAICCSEACAEDYAHESGLAADKVSRRAFPTAPKNLVLEIALARFRCDQCGVNLADLNAERIVVERISCP
jgi:hypothetical protein